MNEKELCNYIKTHFKAEKGTILFFYLSEHAIFANLKPIVLKEQEQLGDHVPKGIFYAHINALEDEVIYFFSCTKFFTEENLSRNFTIEYHHYMDIDLEQVKKELRLLINSKAS